jgi:hypothetical protein
MGFGFEIRDPEKPIPDPGSTRHRIPDPDLQQVLMAMFGL